MSFASENFLAKLNQKPNELKETENEKRFGNTPIVFAGDFTQLEPVSAKPLYFNEHNHLWFETVTTFIELKTNHRFHKDESWGKLLAKIREEGASVDDLKLTNQEWHVWKTMSLRMMFLEMQHTMLQQPMMTKQQSMMEFLLNICKKHIAVMNQFHHPNTQFASEHQICGSRKPGKKVIVMAANVQKTPHMHLVGKVKLSAVTRKDTTLC